MYPHHLMDRESIQERMSSKFYIEKCTLSLSLSLSPFDERWLSISTAASFHFMLPHSFHPESSSLLPVHPVPGTRHLSFFLFIFSLLFRAKRRELFQPTLTHSLFRYFHAHRQREERRGKEREGEEKKRRRRLKERNGKGKTAASITMRVSVYVCRDEHMQRCKYKYTTSD